MPSRCGVALARVADRGTPRRPRERPFRRDTHLVRARTHSPGPSGDDTDSDDGAAQRRPRVRTVRPRLRRKSAFCACQCGRACGWVGGWTRTRRGLATGGRSRALCLCPSGRACCVPAAPAATSTKDGRAPSAPTTARPGATPGGDPDAVRDAAASTLRTWRSGTATRHSTSRRRRPHMLRAYTQTRHCIAVCTTGPSFIHYRA